MRKTEPCRLLRKQVSKVKGFAKPHVGAPAHVLTTKTFWNCSNNAQKADKACAQVNFTAIPSATGDPPVIALAKPTSADGTLAASPTEKEGIGSTGCALMIRARNTPQGALSLTWSLCICGGSGKSRNRQRHFSRGRSHEVDKAPHG